MVADCKDAYRQVPIRPDQRRFLVMKVGERYVVDTCLARSLQPATDIFGSLVDALRHFIEFNWTGLVGG
jgi:hypothetical protein